MDKNGRGIPIDGSPLTFS